MTNNDLVNKIKRLEAIEPSETWLSSNREFLLKYIELDESKRKEVRAGFVSDSSAIRSRIASVLVIFQNRMFAGAVAMAAIFILTGNFVAIEAEKSLPGDALYSVKTFMEKTELALASNDDKRIELNFELTERRLNEFSAVAAKKDVNSGEVKTAADNLKNQLKVAAQELDTVKNTATPQKAVTVAKIADTKTAAYAKKLNEVKKDLSDNKQAQVTEVAQNIEELSNTALAVLATNSKTGDISAEDIAIKLKEKIAAAAENIDLVEKNVAVYDVQVKTSAVVDVEALNSIALSIKLIIEARSVIADAQVAFNEGNYSKTLDLLVNVGEIIKVADNVGNRAIETPVVTPVVTPLVSAEPTVTPETSAEPSISPLPSITPAVSPTPSIAPEMSVAPSPTLIPKITPIPAEPTL